MVNKNKKKWFYYALFAIVALLIMASISDEEINTFAFTPQEEEKNSPKPEDLSLELLNKANRLPAKINYKPYEIPLAYPTQHFFDGNICNHDEIRTDYKPSLKKALKRLSVQYKHHTYLISDHIELNLYATKMTDFFEQELINRIGVLHREYIKLLGASAKRSIRLHLVITPERVDYEQYLSFYANSFADSFADTIGVYLSGLNIAYVDYQGSDTKALSTAIHETVHAFNAHIIGETPPMFNEGMAELYENLRIKDDKISIILSTAQLAQAPLPLMQFFDAQQWSSLDIQHLYYSSWAWVTFMFNDTQGIQSLISFMKQEQINPCSAFSAGESYEIFQEQSPMFEPAFYHWQQTLNTPD